MDRFFSAMRHVLTVTGNGSYLHPKRDHSIISVKKLIKDNNLHPDKVQLISKPFKTKEIKLLKSYNTASLKEHNIKITFTNFVYDTSVLSNPLEPKIIHEALQGSEAKH